MNTEENALKTTMNTNDLYRKRINPRASDRQLVRMARWTTVILGVAAIALALAVFLLADEARIGFTFLEIGVIAIKRYCIAVAEVEIAGQRQCVRKPVLGNDVDQAEFVLGLIRPRKYRLTLELEQFDRRRAVANQIRVRERQPDIDGGPVQAPAERAKELQRFGRRIVAPAVLLEIRAGQKIAEAVVVRAAGRGLDADTAETFLALVEELRAGGAAVVVASHDPVVCGAGLFAQVVRLRGGRQV